MLWIANFVLAGEPSYCYHGASDKRPLKYFVGVLIFLDVFDMACLVHSQWWTFITYFGDFETVWSYTPWTGLVKVSLLRWDFWALTDFIGILRSVLSFVSPLIVALVSFE